MFKPSKSRSWVAIILLGIAVAEITGWSWRVFLPLAAAVFLVSWVIEQLTKKASFRDP